MKNPSGVLEPVSLPGRLLCEYLIVGTGAGGSVAGAMLAEAGRDVILLEEGGYHPSETSSGHIGEMMRRLYRNGGIFPFLGFPMIPFAEACCVGGGTAINGGLIWRTPSWILEEWKKDYGLEGYDGENLAKHFEAVERDLCVTTHRLERDANLDSYRLYEGAERLSWKTAMAPRAVRHCKNVNLCPIGCPPCGKESMLENYIPRALGRGARLVTHCRAMKIVQRHGSARQLIARGRGGGRDFPIAIDFDYLVVAGGAIQTPHLLWRGGLGGSKRHGVQFHINLKTVAVFGEEIRAHKGTMFTVQLQEFEREGLLMMATNLAPHYLTTTLARHGVDAMNRVLKEYFRSAIYTTQVKSLSRAHVVSSWADPPLVWYRLNPQDIPKIKLAIRRTAEVLFASGAVELYLPMKGSNPVKSLKEVDEHLEKLQPKFLDMVTVHVMASCPMGPRADTSTVRPDGRLWNSENVLVADASILPSNTGESPQGTIMAFVREAISRHLER